MIHSLLKIGSGPYRTTREEAFCVRSRKLDKKCSHVFHVELLPRLVVVNMGLAIICIAYNTNIK